MKRLFPFLLVSLLLGVASSSHAATQSGRIRLADAGFGEASASGTVANWWMANKGPLGQPCSFGSTPQLQGTLVHVFDLGANKLSATIGASFAAPPLNAALDVKAYFLAFRDIGGGRCPTAASTGGAYSSASAVVDLGTSRQLAAVGGFRWVLAFAESGQVFAPVRVSEVNVSVTYA